LEYAFTVTGIHDVAEIKSRVVDAMKSVPGTLSEPAPEALLSELSDLTAGSFKITALWWIRSPRQHQMLSSYDAVLTAIQHTLTGSGTTAQPKGRVRSRLANPLGRAAIKLLIFSDKTGRNPARSQRRSR
jgi:hypothetical protein